MDTKNIENNLLLWLVTQPDGSHYIMFSTSTLPPQKGKVEDPDTHEFFDAWQVEDCVYIKFYLKNNV